MEVRIIVALTLSALVLLIFSFWLAAHRRKRREFRYRQMGRGKGLNREV